ncbi:MAG: hypothetical protein ACYDDB_04055 [bacterium]
MEIKQIINKTSHMANEIQNCILFYTCAGLMLLSVIVLFQYGRFNFPRLALSISLAAITTYLFLKNRNKKTSGEKKNDENRTRKTLK